MELNARQRNIVESKSLGYNLIKGVTGSGKTISAVHRSIYLENSYCLYDSDKILMVAYNNAQEQYIKELYNEVKKNNEFKYITLFSNENHNLKISNIQDIIYKYFIDGKKSGEYSFSLIENEQEKDNIISQCIEEVKKLYKGVKILNDKYIKFIINEISWIKSCNYISQEKYQTADRIGRSLSKIDGPKRLSKNSRTREAIFKVMILYNEKLREKNLIDLEDMTLIALEQCKKHISEKYTHIIVDESENLTKVQLDFIKQISANKTYSSTTYIVNEHSYENPNGWLIKTRKINSLGLQGKIKAHLLTIKYESKLQKQRIEYAMESFKYCDIRHGKTYELLRDINNISEIIVKDEDMQYECSQDELKKLSVYNDIAAGEPILMNPDIEDNFYIPTYWIKGMDNCFILKVRGDSMIGANIDSGDYVIIRKQYAAQNKDIVAVNIEGNATLKRLVMKKEGIYLMPENKNYNPIRINQEGASIIGIAVGVIKVC